MRRTVYAAIDLHLATSVLGVMNSRGEMLSINRFATSEENLRHHVAAIEARDVSLTIEASGLSRWAAGVLRPLVKELIVCDPRYNRLVSQSPQKRDEFDVEALCELERLGSLHEVWMGQDEDRAVFRSAVYELLKFRDEQRELKTHIKTRYRSSGILKLDGRALFHHEKRNDWISQMPPPRRAGLLLLYELFDASLSSWKRQLAEVVRLGRAYPEIDRFMEVPGIAEIGAHVFSAMVENPHRFRTSQQLYRFCALAITSRSSDGKPLGYERLDRSGRRELKTISYHAWRTGIRLGQQSDVIRRFYEASWERTGTARHARLNTQRKILRTLWVMWKNDTHFDPELFLQTPQPAPARKRRRRPRRTRSPKAA